MENVGVYISVLLVVVGVLTTLTNVIVQVLKKATWDKLPTNLLALIVAEAMTLTAYFGVSAAKGYPVFWYTVAAAVVVGFLVSFAAMFGFDKLKELFAQLGVIQDESD